MSLSRRVGRKDAYGTVVRSTREAARRVPSEPPHLCHGRLITRNGALHACPLSLCTLPHLERAVLKSNGELPRIYSRSSPRCKRRHCLRPRHLGNTHTVAGTPHHHRSVTRTRGEQLTPLHPRKGPNDASVVLQCVAQNKRVAVALKQQE